MGSAAMDAAGNLALAFSVAGAAVPPSIRYAGRLATDPPGTLTLGEGSLAAGSGSQTHVSGRWGDYSMMAVDPIDGCTFWYTQEYYAGTSGISWHTRIGSFAFPACTPASSLPSVTIAATSPAAKEAGPVSGSFMVTNGVLDAGDTLIGTRSVPALGAGAGDPATNSFVVPQTVAAGLYYLIAKADVTGTVGEAVETNNVKLGSSIKIGPDMVVASVTAPAVAGAGDIILVTDGTKNQGLSSAPASVTGFYLSTDTLLDGSDLALGTRMVPALTGAATDSASTAMPIPGALATGTYFVLARADINNDVAESVETNNVLLGTAVRIGPDLTISALIGPSSAAAGSTMVVSDTTRNSGGGAARSSTTQFYLSTNFTLDISDVLLGGRTVASLAPGSDNSGSTSVTVPAGTVAGTYYLIAVADGVGAVAETSETNNTRFVAIKIVQ